MKRINMNRSELSFATPAYMFLCTQCHDTLIVTMDKNTEEPVKKLVDHGWLLFEGAGPVCGACTQDGTVGVYAETCPKCARSAGWFCRDDNDTPMIMPHHERIVGALNKRNSNG